MMFWIYTWLGFNAGFIVITLARYAYLRSFRYEKKQRLTELYESMLAEKEQK